MSTISLHSVFRRLHFALVATCLILAEVKAAPVTFEFSTTVASVSQFSPREIDAPLPFTVAEGDSLKGTFTFESEAGLGVYPQTAQLQLFVGLQELRMDIEIFVVNNGLGFIDTPGRLADPGRTPDVDRQLFLADRIKVACPTDSELFCGAVVDYDAFKFRSVLVFEDDQNLQILSSTDIPGDPEVWNSMRNRELEIKFNNGISIGAFIGTLRAIPEPAAIQIAAPLGVAFFLRLLKRHARRTRC